MTIPLADLFTVASVGLVQLLAVISPGPSFLITVRTAVARSRFDGVKVALGLGVGSSVWATAALLGLNTLFHLMPILFTGMKVVGALFLLWLAFRLLRHAAEPTSVETGEVTAAESPFLKGLLTQLSNPKVVVFFGSIFVAMLPASVPGWMAATLVAVVAFNEIAWYSILALLFGTPRIRLAYGRAKPWIDRLTGAFLGVLGLRLLASATDAEIG